MVDLNAVLRESDDSTQVLRRYLLKTQAESVVEKIHQLISEAEGGLDNFRSQPGNPGYQKDGIPYAAQLRNTYTGEVRHIAYTIYKAIREELGLEADYTAVVTFDHNDSENLGEVKDRLLTVTNKINEVVQQLQ